MSQHIFTRAVGDHRYFIQMGWDKPLQMYHAVVFKWIEDSMHIGNGYWDQDNPVWSSVFEDRQLSLQDIADTVTELGIDLPENILQNILNDRFRNAVNEQTHYSEAKNPKRQALQR